MPEYEKKNSRRAFLKTVGSFGAVSMFASAAPFAKASDESDSKRTGSVTMPTRPFGKTGENVPILALGGVLDMSDLIIFRQAFKMGVTYWDTADSYGWGKNEKAIGKYFAKFPQDRKNVFLVTKAGTSDPEELTQKLNTSLQRMSRTYNPKKGIIQTACNCEVQNPHRVALIGISEKQCGHSLVVGSGGGASSCLFNEFKP